ncbi:MAG: hypothetical protein WD995_14010 [Gemmatimonadota bacterium]
MFKRLFYLAFIALGITMAVPSLRAELSGFVRPYVDDVKARFVPRQLRSMADQLDARLRRAGGLPAGFEGWLRRSFSGKETDPWDNFYYLVAGRRDYYVGSMGPDGVQATEDDITEPARPISGEGPRER